MYFQMLEAKACLFWNFRGMFRLLIITFFYKAQLRANVFLALEDQETVEVIIFFLFLNWRRDKFHETFFSENAFTQ